ncbi:HNH endonuclease, partial [Microbacterium sp. Sa4CUA7]|nr:HNH endonuclease [Microbacterium pullorum]
LKHHTAWTVTQHPDGTLEWTSPTGQNYLDIPHRTLEFTATATATADSGAPPPF